jgi:hypothetical protein
MNKPFVLSWSKLNDYEQCPYKFWLLHGSKYVEGKAIVPFKTNEHLERGNRIHELMEGTIKRMKDGSAVIHTSKLWQIWWGDMLNNVLSEYPYVKVEEKIGIDENGKAYELDKWWKPIYSGQTISETKPVIIHGKIDAIFHDQPQLCDSENVLLVDWKTGKVRKPEGIGQLALYSLLAMSKWPMKKLKAVFVFLDYKKQHPEEYSEESMDEIMYAFKQKHEIINRGLGHQLRPEKKLLFDGYFSKKKSGLCPWCPAELQHCENK